MTTSVHICDHPNHVAVTAIQDRAEVRYCGACDSSWSELGTRGHRWPNLRTETDGAGGFYTVVSSSSRTAGVPR